MKNLLQVCFFAAFIFLFSSLSAMHIETEQISERIKRMTKKQQKECLKQLCYALYHGDRNEVENLLRMGINPNGSLREVKYLIEPLTRKDKENWRKRGLNSYDRALSFLVYFVIRDRTRVTPLQLAIWRGHADIVELLIQCGADVDALSSTTLLSRRRSIGYPPAAQRCIVRPLDLAILIGRATTIMMLIRHRAIATCDTRTVQMLWGEDLVKYALASDYCYPFFTTKALKMSISRYFGFKELLKNQPHHKDQIVSDDPAESATSPALLVDRRAPLEISDDYRNARIGHLVLSFSSNKKA